MNKTAVCQKVNLMQVFHWRRQAGNYAFLESRDQCLHGQLGSVTSSRLVPNMDFQTVCDDSPTMREVLQYSQ